MGLLILVDLPLLWSLLKRKPITPAGIFKKNCKHTI